MITIATPAGARRYLVGRRIAAVYGTRVEPNGWTAAMGEHRKVFHIGCIDFDDGSAIALDTAELASSYATIVTYFATGIADEAKGL